MICWIFWRIRSISCSVIMSLLKLGPSMLSVIKCTLDKYMTSDVKIQIRIYNLFCFQDISWSKIFSGLTATVSPQDSFTQIMMGFSAQTKCAQTQDLIDAKLDRRRKGSMGFCEDRENWEIEPYYLEDIKLIETSLRCCPNGWPWV